MVFPWLPIKTASALTLQLPDPDVTGPLPAERLAPAGGELFLFTSVIFKYPLDLRELLIRDDMLMLSLHLQDFDLTVVQYLLLLQKIRRVLLVVCQDPYIDV